MCSNGLKTRRPAKILHRVAIFAACLARNMSLNTAGSHFIYPVAILKPLISCWKIVVLRRIGSWSREPITAKRNSPIENIILWSQKRLQKVHHNAISSLNEAIVMRGTTVWHTEFFHSMLDWAFYMQIQLKLRFASPLSSQTQKSITFGR